MTAKPPPEGPGPISPDAIAAARAALPGRVGAHRVGLLGGSFNPAHAGHLHISRLAIETLRLHEVWWLVSPQNPLKPSAGMAPHARRLAGARALARDSRIRVTDLERRLGTRYTIDTLRAIKAAFPELRFVWLMGADNLAQLPRWRQWRDILAESPVAIFDRPSYAGPALSGVAAREFERWRVDPAQGANLLYRRLPAWIFFRTPLDDTSATEIRARPGQ
jgi:nicotinate-nucleotide adenylyltransferase